MPRSVPLIYAVLLCMSATTMRFLIRILGQKIIKKNIENVAIYGAGSIGIQLMEALRKNQSYHVKLFIDDDPQLHGKILVFYMQHVYD